MNGCLRKKSRHGNFRKILLDNGFPKSISVHHIRKKWNYTLDEYHKAVAQNNKRWYYYDVFCKYLGECAITKNYSNWDDEWLFQLIKIRTNFAALFPFTYSDTDDGWIAVECELRKMGLPTKCAVKKVDKIWFSLIKTFKTRHKFCNEEKLSNNTWPFYDEIKEYFNLCDPSELDNNHKNITKQKTSGSLSENENCDKDHLNKSANPDGVESFNLPSFAVTQNDVEEFRWTPEWTESFIHIRLQNDALFKQKKQAWKDLHTIMMNNGFPKSITVNHIRKKWNSTFEEYQKSVALNNTKWIYYKLINNYLGKSELKEVFKNWNSEWIKKLIKARIDKNETFQSSNLTEDDCWIIIEGDLRNEGLPCEFSVRNIDSMWSSLIKTFKIKHKYVNQNKTADVWEFYDDMYGFFVKCDVDFLTQSKASKKNTNHNVKNDSGDDAFFSDDFDMKSDDNSNAKKDTFSIESCRACLGKSNFMTPLFDSNISSMITSCTSIQISELDNFPKQICQDCVKELEIAFKFKTKCEESDRYLKNVSFQEQNDVRNEADDDMSTSNSPDIRCDYESDVAFKDNPFENDDSEPSIPSARKRKRRESATKKSKTNSENTATKKPQVKSKNLIMVPIVTDSGETIYKRKYVYWKVCDICGKSTQRMNEHMKGHSGEKSHMCTMCPKTFTYSASLQTHMRTHDTTPLKVCQVCGKEFFRNLTYKRHLIYHANERKFSCETCGKTFNTSDILKVHTRSHTGERPYSCKICSKSFYSRGCVVRHQKIHRKQLI